MATHYVDNKQFLQAIKDYKIAVAEATQAGNPKPRIPNYIGNCILQIANHLSYKHNFINYSFRDEMVSDGIENCLMYFDNFDPDRFNNPFAYFTQIIYYAFIRRIQREKKQTLIKGKILMDMPFESFEVQNHDEDGTYANAYLDFVQAHGIYDNVLQKEEQKKTSKKKKATAKQTPLVEMFEVDTTA